MKNVPEKIYLQIDADGETPEDFNELEVSWCADRINENDIAYIREPSSPDRTTVSIKANEDAIIVNGKRYVKESETGEQEEIMKALEEARCLDPESENWSYHAASRIALEAIKKTRKPLDR